MRTRLLADAMVATVVIAIELLHPAVAGEQSLGFPAQVMTLCRRYVEGFGSEQTNLLYHHRLDGPAGIGALTTPADIQAGTVRGEPVPYGYGSGIQDVALENGQLLFALCEVFDATGDEPVGELARWVFAGLRRVATVSAVAGFVPRGPHPDGVSYYRDSSRDQHAALAEALWRYGRSGLATVDDRQFIARELNEMAQRLESNDWKILVEDGTHVAHLGFDWRQRTAIGAISLLSFLSMVADATGQRHWQELCEQYGQEDDAIRWQLLQSEQVATWKPLTLYSNQFAQALLALQRCTADPQRQQQIRAFLVRLAERSLDGHVLDQGIPTAAFHQALLSEHPQLVHAVAPAVRDMVNTMLAHGADYDRGENFNRTVVLGLLLWAADAQRDEPSNQHSSFQSLQSLAVGPTMDVEYADGLLYAIGQGRLWRIDPNAAAGRSAVTGVVSGLGHVRQLSVQDQVAYVTSREDGLFLVDLHRMEILSHYDTIELATGIAVAGEVACVACRTAGVELVDVSDPRQARHLSTVRTGEAQSVSIQGNTLYAGVWGTGELVICDISDRYRPSVIARAKLQGYGDGVTVRGTLAFVATGHHRKGAPSSSPLEPGYGRGHGLEIFDVADPRQPQFLGRVSFPGFYRLGMDMWEVRVAGDRAYVADTHNGVFVVDISQPSQPRIAARYVLPFVDRQEDPSPAAGVCVADQAVFIAGAWSDVHWFSSPTHGHPLDSRPATRLSVGPPPAPRSDPRFRTYHPPGQVHAVVTDSGIAFVACGAAGLHAVELAAQINPLHQYRTRGFALDVAASRGRVYVAEGNGGLSVWRHEQDGQLAELGRYEAVGESIRQVVIANDTFALLHVGPSTLQVVDVRDPQQIRQVLADSRLGLFYYHPLAPGLLDGRYACCHWHVSGLFLYDMLAAPPRFSGQHQAFRIGSHNGVAYRDSRILITARGGFLWATSGPHLVWQDLPIHRLAAGPVHGKPTLAGNRLFLSDRYTGVVTAVDISDPVRPQLIAQAQLEEHPGLVSVDQGLPLIPAGYQGLLCWDSIRLSAVDAEQSATAGD